MKKAYKIAALAVRKRLAEQRPDDLALLGSGPKRSIVVLPGTFDQAEKVLDCLAVPYHSCTRLLGRALKKAHLAFVNCGNVAYADTKITALRDFAARGGWVVSSDWALRHVVQEAFPETIRWNGKTSADEVVSVEAARDSLWADVVVPGCDPQWWLEASSYPIEIVGEAVRVEAASHELLVRYGAPVVSAQFDWQAGRVFHVVSHFWLKRSRARHDRHQGPCVDFLRAGMRLSDAGIEEVLRAGRISADALSFGDLQTAATSTELVAQLCIQATRAHTLRC